MSARLHGITHQRVCMLNASALCRALTIFSALSMLQVLKDGWGSTLSVHRADLERASAESSEGDPAHPGR